MINSRFCISDKLVKDILLIFGNASPTLNQYKLAEKLLNYAVFKVNHYRVKKLSERKRACLLWIAHGKTIEEIVVLMQVKSTTIQTYCQRIRSKLKCATLTQAVFWIMCYQPCMPFYNLNEK